MTVQQPRQFWQYQATAADAAEVTASLTALRERVAVGEPLTQQMALMLLDLVISQREPHTHEPLDRGRVAFGASIICRAYRCGEQVMPTYLTDPASGTVVTEPGMCPSLKEIDYPIRGGLGLTVRTPDHPDGEPVSPV